MGLFPTDRRWVEDKSSVHVFRDYKRKDFWELNIYDKLLICTLSLWNHFVLTL